MHEGSKYACGQQATGIAQRGLGARHHDRALRKDDDLRIVARYLIANPLRAGMVERVGDYPFWDAIWLP
ncbi:hypothetical protein FHR61_000481 [Xanthomonas arboricola]|uniref:Transposase n=1 Tax=Xanthomonas cannabis TaxID=1885674 RepID=A0ABR6JKD9_9XANT|nr:hypothetical protein [Xanthomonas cannabis]MBB5520685.1 hypothetical protein [Xanthomonas cannabis]